MTNFEIYKKTLKLSLLRFLISLCCVAVVFGLPVAAFLITQNMGDTSLLISGGAFVIGCVIAGLIGHFVSHVLKAGQLAMMAEGVDKGQLPENVFQGAREAVKKRFVTVGAFYVVDRLVNGITHQVTNAVTRLGNAVSGDKKNDGVNIVVTIVNLLIALVMRYVCACTMAWVFIHPEENAFKLACDGAVVYFQNWKALLKNVFKVLVIGLLSLAIVAAPLTIGFHAILAGQEGAPALMNSWADFINKAYEGSKNEVVIDGATMLWIVSAVLALVIWCVIDTALVEPFVQVTVLRTYIDAAKENPPKVDVYGKLSGISKKFKEALGKSKEAAAA